MTSHERLRECLARFKTSCGGAGTEQQPAGVGEAVRDADTQRHFGTDDGEIDLFAFGQVQ